MNVRVLLCAVLLAAVPLCVTGADARERAKPEPEAVQTYDPAKRYVFYLHGLYMDKRGPRGETDYPGIHAALEGMGFVVMTTSAACWATKATPRRLPKKSARYLRRACRRDTSPSPDTPRAVSSP